MSLNSNQSEKLTLHLLECVWMSVLKIHKRLQKAKCVRASEWTKYDTEWIELAITAEVMKRDPSQ